MAIRRIPRAREPICVAQIATAQSLYDATGVSKQALSDYGPLGFEPGVKAFAILYPNHAARRVHEGCVELTLRGHVAQHLAERFWLGAHISLNAFRRFSGEFGGVVG